MRNIFSLYFMSMLISTHVYPQDIPLNPDAENENGRQGKWTILYDSVWNIITSKENALYYRLIEYQDDKPFGIVRDFFLNGQLQMEATLLADRPQDVFEGEAIWYRTNGTKELSRTFDDGKFISENKFDEKGEIILHYLTLQTMGREAYSSKSYTKAIDLFRRSHIQIVEKHGENNSRAIEPIRYLAFCHDLLAQYDQAEDYYQKYLATQAMVNGETHQEYVTGLYNLGWLQYRLGKYLETESTYKEAIELLEKSVSTEELLYARVLNGLGILYRRQGKFNETEALYLKVKDIRKKNLGETHPDYITTLNNLAVLYQSQGRYSQAETLNLKVVELRLKTEGKENSKYAQSVNNLAVLYYRMGQYKKSEPLMSEAKEIRERLFGKSHPEYAASLNDLAGLYQELGRLDEAEPLFQESLALREKLLGKNHPDYATVVMNLALLFRDQGHFTKAEEFYLNAIEIKKNVFGEYHHEHASALRSFALFCQDTGQLHRAEELYNQVLKIQTKVLGKENGEYGRSLNNLAGLYEIQGLYAKAEPVYLEAKKIVENTFGVNNRLYASILNNQAVLYSKQGFAERAKSLYIESKNIRQKILGSHHPEYAISLNNLATFYDEHGLYSQAELLHLEAKIIREKTIGRVHPFYAATLNNLATNYLRQNIYSKVEELYLEAQDIWSKTIGKETSDYASSLGNLANLYAELGQFEKSISYYQESKNIRAKILGPENNEYGTTLSNLAAVYESTSQWDKAEEMFVASNEVALKQIEINFSSLSEKEKTQFYKTFSFNFEHFHSFVLKRYMKNPNIIGVDYNTQLATKGLFFQSQQKIKNTILASGNQSLIETYNQWVDQRSRLGKLYGLSLKERMRSGTDIEAEQEKANLLEKELSSRSLLFKSANDQQRYTWQDVRKTLRRNEAAIEMVRFKYYDKDWTDSVMYLAMIVTPKTLDHPELVVFAHGSALDGQAHQKYRNRIKYKLKDKDSYDTFWKPMEAHLEGVNKIYLSADGAYHSVSLGGLFNPASNKYLSDELKIQRVSSTKDLVVAKRERKPKNKVQLLGFPDYNANSGKAGAGVDRSLERVIQSDSTTRFFDGSDIPVLPGTKEEVENMESLFSKSNLPVQTYLSVASSEQAVRSWKNPKIVHIATHGYFLKDKDLEKNDSKLAGISKEMLVENPLLRSGLLLANAKQAIQSGGDGILTAYEARDLQLDETELVVLSACETGLGEVKNGEGVYGLQRAFMSAGAASVIMSLWTVSDQATQELMTSFYENWLIKGQTKREAFESARKTLRVKYAHPYYWAAFVMMGE